MLRDLADPEKASLDRLIEWVRRRRTENPTAGLAELLPCQNLDPGRLVDLACIDLIQRRRMGHVVGTEDYLDEFPLLDSSAARLDLIDAELCVANELGETVDTDALIDRFPELCDSIRELVQLDDLNRSSRPPMPPSSLIPPSSMHAVGRSQSRDATAGTIRPATPSLPAGRPEVPPDLPDWFVEAEWIAETPHRQLVRGRDSKRGIPLAMKTIRFVGDVPESRAQRLLDACEAASRVQNPNWVAPLVAAITDRGLVVVRPWVFANPWKPADLANRQPAALLRQLASISYSLQAAHDAGAIHGGLHPGNVLIDHDGHPLLVDAMSSVVCTQSGGFGCNGEKNEPTSVEERIKLEVRRWLVSLHPLLNRAAATQSSRQVDWDQLNTIADRHPGQACGMIGDQLMRGSDQ